MTCSEGDAHGLKVAGLERGDNVEDTSVLGDNVLRSTGHDRIEAMPFGGQHLERHVAKRTNPWINGAERFHRQFTLVAPLVV